MRAFRWTMAAFCVVVGLVALVEYDARRVWRACSAGGFRFAEASKTLTRRSWFLRVRCEDGLCRWRSLHSRWHCSLVDDGGMARPGGSG